MDLTPFIVQNTVIVVPALYAFGFLIKKIKPIPDFLIPFILTLFGILLCGLIMGFSADSVIQGIFTSSSAVLINQYKKQASKGKDYIFSLSLFDLDDGE